VYGLVGVEVFIAASIMVYCDEESARPHEERRLWDEYGTLGRGCTEECDEVDIVHIPPSSPDSRFSGISLCDELTLVTIGLCQDTYPED
jgi:hypothetical protein